MLLSNQKSPPIFKDTAKIFVIKLANACACSVNITVPEFEHKEPSVSVPYLHTYIFFSLLFPDPVLSNIVILKVDDKYSFNFA